MSSPSTPSRQHGPSSTSTPSRQQGPSSTSTPSTISLGSPSGELTPKSKVRALLAAIDDDSDVEVGTKNNSSAHRDGPGAASGTAPPNQERIGGSDDDGEEDADDEEVMPIVPKGRLAARMLGTKERVVEEEQRGESAYEKVKRQLMRGAKRSGEGSTGLSTKRDDPAEASSEDNRRTADAGAQRLGKRTLARTSRQGTPTSPGLQSPRSSPGLFLSPGLGSPHKEAEAVATGPNGSDSDLPTRPTENSRFLALVARKREERLAKEEAESRKKAEREAQLKVLSKHKRLARGSSPVVGSEDDSDGNAGGRKLTQEARPTRKASKKALEEMNRETQRMSRNMQLAHQARTKKKITKESFFAKFNFKPLGGVATDTGKAISSSTAASSATVSDAEGLQLRETPPTSPVCGEDSVMKMDAGYRDSVISSTEHSAEMMMNPDEELPTIEDVMTQPVHRLDKGKSKVTEPERSPTPRKKKETIFHRPIKVRPSMQLAQLGNRMVDSDSDLEIVAEPVEKPKKTDIFDRLPTEKPTDARSLLTLRTLANLASPGKQNSKSKASMTPTDLQTCLRKRARQQAAQERAEKLQQLRDKGIVVQTAEERQRDQAEVEDLVEKARREAEDIMKKEKNAANKDGRESGKTDGLDDTSDEDDEEYADDVEEEIVELSGSEEEEEEDGKDGEEGSNNDEEEVEGDADVQDDEEDKLAMNENSEDIGALIDQEASEDEEEDAEGDNEASEDEEDQAVTTHKRKKSKNTRVILDDDDDGDSIPIRCSSEAAVSVQNPFIPGLPTSAGIPLGLTQAFAATMADSQSQVDDTVMAHSLDQEQDSLTFLTSIPEPNFPDFDATVAHDFEDVVRDSQLSQTQSRVKESQEAGIRPDIDLHYSQSQIRYDSMLDTQRMPTATQYSELPDPTQDVGFAISSPPAGHFGNVPPSTVDTVLLSGVRKETSPLVKKKGRLRRRAEAISVLTDAEQNIVPLEAEGDFLISPNVFDVMRKAAQKPAPIVNDFDKKKSEAKGMVEEQAEESEDEYAGLGGASDDESGGSEDEEMQKMIDESDIKVDERKLAAFYADKERASDAKAVEKLFKDMNSGLLRRKRGADIDLSDDSDDGEARRRRKQREFAKMRKALLADENIGKIADNPKKLAFLRAIEDRERDADDDDGLDFLDGAPDDDALQDTQTGGGADSQSQTAAPPNKRKRPLEDSIPDTANRRPPPHLRHTHKAKKPATLAEIRASVSFLLEEPHAEVPVALGLESSDVEDDDNHNHNHNNDDGHNSREQARKPPNPDPGASHRRRPTNPIIDRIALKRASSSAAPSSGNTKLAFYDPSAAAALPSAFRVPSLLRRATTQVTGSSETNHGVTERMATATATVGSTGGEGAGGVKMKMGGSKKSSINYFARERERKALVEGRVREREVGRLRVAVRERRGLVGVFGEGRWG